MPRRPRKLSFGRVFQRSVNALTRATLRSGSRVVSRAVRQAGTQVAKQQARRQLPTSAHGSWLAGIAVGHGGARRYQLFRPAGAAAPLPLLVMLHGCNQDAAGFARSTRLHTLALREGFMLLYPEQERLANAQGCWSWFETRSGRAFAEAGSILAAIDQACTLHGADPTRVAVAGFSAGAGMAALLALRHPERFQAVVMHSGVAPGAAHSTATALGAMQGRRRPTPLEAGVQLPPLLAIQGNVDSVVARSNARAAVELWAGASGARERAPRRLQRGARHAMTLTDFKRAGQTMATLCDIERLGHAWSGGAAGQPYSDPAGPDAGRLAWSFAARCFDRRAAHLLQSAAKQ